LGGGAAARVVVPVVSGGFCSDAVIRMLRAFGAGLGSGTAGTAGAVDAVEKNCSRDCAEEGVATPATDMAINPAKPRRRRGTADCTVMAVFEFLFNASSRLVIGPFIVLSLKGGIVFP
jgi:hypothetical protein